VISVLKVCPIMDKAQSSMAQVGSPNLYGYVARLMRIIGKLSLLSIAIIYVR